MIRLPPKLAKSKPKRDGRLRCPAHLKFVRSHSCSVNGCDLQPIEAAHVRIGTDAQAMGAKPGDNWTVSLCYSHHRVQHDEGERRFEIDYRINLKALAAEFWRVSPHRKRAEAKMRRAA